ncbi:MAG TPA: LegC family aminotransferase [Kiritimatiellia bacterium]|nr:LegC family aminotransferase [Kiritimatiellia bacterium]
MSNISAIDGSQKSMPPSFIPLSVPEVRGCEWKYIKECLDTNWVSSVGAFVDRFERDLASFVGARHAVACTSGTAALHVSLLVAGVRPDDEVLVSDLTFIAPANAVRYCGAWPIFIDAEPDYWQMDVRKVEEFLIHGCRVDGKELRNRKTGRRVSAILPVHALGHPVDMDPLMELARRFGLVVLEDATESIGAKYKGVPTGHLGHIACFSFNGNKIMTTGGGGMMVTDNEAWAKKVRYLTTQAKDDPVEYVHDEIGFNYRLTNIQAAMGCAQLEQLPKFIEKKRAIARRYAAAFDGVAGIECMRQAPWAESIWWMYTIIVDEQLFGMSSRALLKRLEECRIQSRPLWQPLHKNRPYLGAAGEFPVAEALCRNALSLPCSVGLTEADQDRVIRCVLGKS